MRGRNRGLFGVAAVSLVLAWPAGTSAQGLDEIVVSARKREESLQDVPLSITAFNAQRLQESGIYSNYDVANFAVNFNTMQQLGRRLDRPVIRGQPSAAVGGEPNASYFVDGVYVSTSISTASTAAIERVEVLRGPQSAQFGRATFSGAVNYVTRKPTNDFEGEINAKAGTHEDYRASAWISGPLIRDKLLYFLSGSYEKYGGQWKNGLQPDTATLAPLFIDPPQEGDSSDLGGEETTDFVARLTFMPFESSEINFKYSYTEGDDDHFASLVWDQLNCYIPEDPNDPAPASAKPPFSNQFIDQSAPNWQTSGAAYCGTFRPEGATTLVNLPDLRTGVTHLQSLSDPVPEDWIADPAEPGTRRETDRFLLEYVQDIGDWSVTTRGTFNKDEFEQVFDLDRTPARTLIGLFHNVSQHENEDWSFEMRVASPLDRRLRGQLGVYVYDLDSQNRSRRYVGLSGNGQFSDWEIQTTRNEAVFGMLEYDLTENATLSLEARYAEDEKAIESANSVDAENTFENFTPRITFEYNVTDEAMLYALASKGNKPGDFNQAYFDSNVCIAQTERALADGNALVEEEEAWTYELGAKTSWFDNRATANIALYYIDWTNQAVFRNDDIERCGVDQNDIFIVTASVEENAGKSRVIGGEFESTFALNDFVSIRAAYGYTDSEYVEFNDDFFAGLTGIDDPGLINGGNAAGTQIQNVPEHSVVIGIDVSRPLSSDLDAFFRTDLLYESERYTDVGEYQKITDKKTVNVRIGAQGENWTVTGYVTNLLDDTTPTATPSFFDAVAPPLPNGEFENIWTMNPPRGRDWGVELQYRF